MCGIAGYIGPRVIQNDAIKVCLERMHRRGPDVTGVYRQKNTAFRHVCLLHSRLSILDLDSRSNQPFVRHGRAFVFNGELYNYLEIRRELEGQNQNFITSGDTEVMFEALVHWGYEGLDRCEGMWGFAFYNESTGSLLLCRDRFGEKPLYLYRDEDGGLYFGSEIKFLGALSGKRFEINKNHLSRYLVNGYKALYKGKETFFKEVEELSPGNVLYSDLYGRETLSRYWEPRFDTQEQDMTFKEAVDGVRERMIESVRLRLRSDVPLAFCMSGGIDSNSLICTAKKIFGHDVHGFTIVNTDERYSEQYFVNQVVGELALKHTPVPLTTVNFLENMRALVLHHDAPVYTVSYYAHLLLMNSVREAGYKISISGTGADELFTGYYDHHSLYLHAIENNKDLYTQSLVNWYKHIKPIVRNPFLQDPLVFIKHPDERGHIYLGAEGYAGYLTQKWSEPFVEEKYSIELLRNRMLNELFHESIPAILHEDDLNAMYFSIENRSPYLDRELFEFSQHIPSRHLVNDGMAKAVLRESMRGIVPDAVLNNRRKVGFNAPILDFLDLGNEMVRSTILSDSSIYEIVRRDAIKALLDQQYLGNSDSKFLFYFLSAKIFLEAFAA